LIDEPIIIGHATLYICSDDAPMPLFTRCRHLPLTPMPRADSCSPLLPMPPLHTPLRHYCWQLHAAAYYADDASAEALFI